MNGFSYHNWWHLALLHLDRDEHAAALDLYDSKVRPDPNGNVLLEWIDGAPERTRPLLKGLPPKTVA